MSDSSVFKMVLACSAAALFSLFSQTVSAQTLTCRSEYNAMLDANGMATISPEDVVIDAPPDAILTVNPSTLSFADIGTGFYVVDTNTGLSCPGNLTTTQ